jgi:hypothetical protein
VSFISDASELPALIQLPMPQKVLSRILVLLGPAREP